MADLAAATTACKTAVEGKTLDFKTRAWNRYTMYCKSIGLGSNLFLKEMSQTHKIKILEVLLWLCIKDNFLDHAMFPWL